MTTEEHDRAVQELRDVARARVDGFHGGLDSSEDLLPVCSTCVWCHTQGAPAAAELAGLYGHPTTAAANSVG